MFFKIKIKCVFDKIFLSRLSHNIHRGIEFKSVFCVCIVIEMH